MEILSGKIIKKRELPVKVLQFGEGNFLRAFADYMLDVLNESENSDYGIVLVRPNRPGGLERFTAQDCLYTVLLRGILNGAVYENERVITSVMDAVDTFGDFDVLADYAKLPSLRFIISNTTEAGIRYDAEDKFENTPPITFPGKLAKLLYLRYKAFDGAADKGLILLPAELIDNNGEELKKCILGYIQLWNLGHDFKEWVESSCIFCSTLVDRIVTGYPKEDENKLWQKLGYKDDLMVAAEPFALWVIGASDDEALSTVRRELPFDKAGLPVIFSNDVSAYKQRKVRILNGAHTCMVPISYLCGNDTVRESVDDNDVSKYIHTLLYNEVIPTLPLPKDELQTFAGEVFERFENPFIRHELMSIALNSISKWRARCLPSLLDYIKKEGKAPKCLTFSLAALLAFYTSHITNDGIRTYSRGVDTYTVTDDAASLEIFGSASPSSPSDYVKDILGCEALWGISLLDKADTFALTVKHLENIRKHGMRAALAALLYEKTLKIDPRDNAVVALESLEAGSTIFAGSIEIKLSDPIPAGHKIALCDIPAGSPVIKYGEQIGLASCDIKKGSHIHSHNLKTALCDLSDYSSVWNEKELSSSVTGALKAQNADIKKSFMGFVRADGNVGIRNEIWIIPTVGCVNNVAKKLAEISHRLVRGSVSDVIAFAHPYGCSQLGDDQEYTRRLLSSLAHHPNAGGVLILGLGCENSNVDILKKYMGEYDSSRIRFMVCQEYEDELSQGKQIISELINLAGADVRSECSISSLTIGLKCGGSDGFSGITANPLVGEFSDLLTQAGGSVLLTEVPEMFGAETLLMKRCADYETFQKLVSLINDFKQYFIDSKQPIYENPSPGNKAGGITTLEEKSLGCIKKSGSSKVCDVLKYAERVKAKGLTLLEAPGNDLVASTALAAAGAQLVLFTTGRGTPFACPVPTVKISSNESLRIKKSNWIDFDASKYGIDSQLTGKFFNYIIDTANGCQTASERADYHDMAIFKRGVTL